VKAETRRSLSEGGKKSVTMEASKENIKPEEEAVSGMETMPRLTMELLHVKGKNSLWQKDQDVNNLLLPGVSCQMAFHSTERRVGPRKMVSLSMGSATIFPAVLWKKWSRSPTPSFHSHSTPSQSSSRQQSLSCFTANSHLCSSMVWLRVQLCLTVQHLVGEL